MRVSASLMVSAVALALMAGRAPAAEPEMPDLKPLFDLLDMLNRSWVGTIREDYNPNGWNGVWPNPSMVIYHEPGGVIKEHVERWQELARSGADVEILGPCYSACTLILAYVPKERLCFGAFATLQFHLAWVRETGKPSLDASLWMLKQYPREIQDWIMTFFNPELCAKRLELIKQAVPPTTHVGVLFNPDNPIYLPCLQEMERRAKSINLELERFEVRAPSEFEGAFLAMDRKGVDGMTVIEDAMLIANSKAVVGLVTERRLPSIAFKEIADGGGLMAYGVNFARLFYRAAYFVDKILKGANPSDLPVEQATKFDLVINLQAAKALGLEIPPMLLALADQVIE